ncbi:MAG: PQQ-like beta-propeller repeat protein [Planctomycetales bacterium]|nr:PQQ-like beta-propeller repeat protein [Planctomycetales bacterium]
MSFAPGFRYALLVVVAAWLGASLLWEQELKAQSAGAQVKNLAQRVDGHDWPDFLGPSRDSKSQETGILTKWPARGLPLVWSHDLGVGYGIGAISRGRYFQFDRFGNVARIYCLQSETGRELWKFEYPCEYEDMLGYNNGPRCSPVVDGERLYAFGVEGMLHCLRVTDGKLLWKRDTANDYGVVQNFFGVGSTPIVVGDLLIAMIGGSPSDSPHVYSGRVQGDGSGIVAFDKFTGKEKYRLSDELASYSSPICRRVGDRLWCFAFARGGLLGFEPQAGKLDFHFPWRSAKLESVNAATPIIVGDSVFITETYGPGSAMLRVQPGNCDVVWQDDERSRDKAMMAHWNTPIYHDGYIYASSGRHTANAELRCIRASDGEVQWSEPGLTRCSLLYADGHLICLSEDGALRLLRATPEKFDEVSEMIPRDGAGLDRLLEYPAWAAPVLSHGLLYVRGKSKLLCFELIPQR